MFARHGLRLELGCLDELVAVTLERLLAAPFRDRPGLLGRQRLDDDVRSARTSSSCALTTQASIVGRRPIVIVGRRGPSANRHRGRSSWAVDQS